MKRTLHLTSPLEHGPDVLALQWQLQEAGYFHSDRDGFYGPLTAQAVYRAKFWLGYRKPDQSAGELLVNLLAGKQPASAAMRARARARRRAKPAVPVRARAFSWLEQRIGDKEHPSGSNRIPWASEWYGVIGPWCAMAVTRAYVECGSKTFARGKRYAYVPFIVNDAHAGRNGLSVTTKPQRGDLVCYDWTGDGIADHVGLFQQWHAGGEFVAVEGNTGIGNDSNGGEVMRRTRNVKQVQVFVHVAR